MTSLTESEKLIHIISDESRIRGLEPQMPWDDLLVFSKEELLLFADTKLGLMSRDYLIQKKQLNERLNTSGKNAYPSFQ